MTFDRQVAPGDAVADNEPVTAPAQFGADGVIAEAR